MIHCLGNILQHSAGCPLSKFQILTDREGNVLDPYTWAHLNTSTDKAPDKVYMDSFSNYELMLNYNDDYDTSHDGMRATKGGLGQAKLWKHVVLYVSAENCSHGSALSPPRLAQVQDSLQFRCYCNGCWCWCGHSCCLWCCLRVVVAFSFSAFLFKLRK